MSTASGRRARARRWMVEHGDGLVLAGLAVLLYLPGMFWGLPSATDAARPRGWAIDAITPLGPMTELLPLLDGSAGYGYVAYPLFHYGVLAVAYAPYLAALALTGALRSPSGGFPYGFADPRHAFVVLTLIARTVSVAMGAGIVVAAAATARTLWGRAAGRAAGAMVLLMYPLTYYAHTGNLDVPTLFWTALGLLAMARILATGVSAGRFAALGACTALATATKDQGWGAFALLPPVLLWLMARRARETGRVDWRPAAAGLAACAAAYLVASGLVLNPWRWVAHLRWLREHVPFPLAENAPPTLAGYLTLLGWCGRHVLDAVGPVVPLAALAGIAAAWRTPGQRVGLALLLAAVGHFVLVLVPVRLSLLRYVMPIAYVVCLFAGRGFAAGLESARAWPRRLAGAAFAAACVIGLLLSVDLTWQSLNDSRYEAARRLTPLLRPADTVASDVSASQLPPLPPGVVYTFIGRDSTSPALVAAQRPPFIIIQPDWTSPAGLPYPERFPAALYTGLGDDSLGYRRLAVLRSPMLFRRRRLDYPTVNPFVTIFVRDDRMPARP